MQKKLNPQNTIRNKYRNHIHIGKMSTTQQPTLESLNHALMGLITSSKVLDSKMDEIMATLKDIANKPTSSAAKSSKSRAAAPKFPPNFRLWFLRKCAASDTFMVDNGLGKLIEKTRELKEYGEAAKKGEKDAKTFIATKVYVMMSPGKENVAGYEAAREKIQAMFEAERAAAGITVAKDAPAAASTSAAVAPPASPTKAPRARKSKAGNPVSKSVVEMADEESDSEDCGDDAQQADTDEEEAISGAVVEKKKAASKRGSKK